VWSSACLQYILPEARLFLLLSLMNKGLGADLEKKLPRFPQASLTRRLSIAQEEDGILRAQVDHGGTLFNS
jgi:hypothetical protein